MARMANLTKQKYQAVCLPFGRRCCGHSLELDANRQSRSPEKPNQQKQFATTWFIARIVTQIASALILVMSFITQPASAVDIQIKGVPKQFRNTLRATLEKPTDDSAESVNEYIKAVPDRAKLAMQSIGYYNSHIELKQSEKELVLHVRAGEPVIISKLFINVEGDARLDGRYMPIIGQMPLRQNLVFQHEDYEKTKDLLFDRAQDRGYFDFEFSQAQVRISKKNNTAEITLIVSSGTRYTFATVEFVSDYFSDDFLQGYVPFEYGDYYESSLLANLTQQMQNTGFFSTVKVIPLRGDLFGEQVPIKVEVNKKDKNLVGLGVGFATDTKARGKITWNRPLVNKKGHSFEAELGVSQINQNLSFQYRIPRSSDPLYNFWSLETGILNEQIEEQSSFLSTVNVQRIRRTRRKWTESLFIRWEREIFEAGEQRDLTNLVLPGISYSKNHSKGFPFPTSGYSLQGTFYWGSRSLASSIDLFKTEFNIKVLKSVSKNDTFILAARYGAIGSNDFERVPTSQRFFVGGDRTIRGFPFRTLSPTDSNGDAIGGRFQEVLNLEYNRRIGGTWALALFTDAGRAFDEFDAPYQVGAGFGLRWFSPVGPFRIDLAFGVSEEDTPFQLHLSLGPEI